MASPSLVKLPSGRLLAALERPFDDHDEAYAGLPPAWAQSLEVSCSS